MNMFIIAWIALVLSSFMCSGGDVQTDQTKLDYFVKSRSFVFISGWPQSGTSFLHQVFTLNPLISSMVENCEKVLGKRCINWNHEGQWLIPGYARNILNSGVMCPHDGNITQADAYALLSEWKPYWSADKVLLVEKSPHSILKIPLLRRVFAGAISLKFIVLLKHPVTLNVATPKGIGWLYVDDKPSPFTVTSGKDRNPSKKLSFAQTHDVMHFFLELMRHNNSTLYTPRSSRCSMGWIPTMTALANQLAADPRSAQDVRIVRFESFQAPLKVCLDLFRFVLDHVSNSTDQLCNKYFGPMLGTSLATGSTSASSSTFPPASSSSATMARLPLASNSKGNKRSSRLSGGHNLNIDPTVLNKLSQAGKPLLLPGQTGRHVKIASATVATGSTTNGRLLHTVRANDANITSSASTSPPFAEKRANGDHEYTAAARSARTRQLRLRSNQESSEKFSFIPELVSERGRQRVREFVAAYQTLGPSMKAKLDAVNRQLKPFGYSLFHWQATDTETSVFGKWDIAEL